MIYDKPGKITDRITLLGRSESCVYHVDGERESIIIGGGMTYIVPDILHQMEEFGLDPAQVKKLVILHSHFDHCGIVPFFKERWPWLVVCASERARQILSDPNITQNIASLNLAAAERAGRRQQLRDSGIQFTNISVDEVLGEGSSVLCGDMEFQVIEVPGHSSCSIALYMPGEKALFASDAAGIQYKGYIFSAGNSNFDLYQESLEKMSRYGVEILLSGHYGACTGEDAKSFLPRAIKSARATRVVLEESYNRTHDVAQSTKEVTEHFLKQAPDCFLPREILSIISGQMVRYIARKTERGTS